VALKPTIYKFKIALSDINRAHYDTLGLTIAQHPSETLERMMVRMLAYCLNARERLVICKGLSDAEEPDLWAHTLDGSLALWIEVGEPAVERVKKASRIATEVKVYSFNSRAITWWNQNRDRFAELQVNVYRLDWEHIKTLALLVQRTMDISVTVSGDSAYVATELGECEVLMQVLQEV
jgi:uncharacterized protein YaeQ